MNLTVDVFTFFHSLCDREQPREDSPHHTTKSAINIQSNHCILSHGLSVTESRRFAVDIALLNVC